MNWKTHTYTHKYTLSQSSRMPVLLTIISSSINCIIPDPSRSTHVCYRPTLMLLPRACIDIWSMGEDQISRTTDRCLPIIRYPSVLKKKNLTSTGIVLQRRYVKCHAGKLNTFFLDGSIIISWQQSILSQKPRGNCYSVFLFKVWFPLWYWGSKIKSVTGYLLREMSDCSLPFDILLKDLDTVCSHSINQTSHLKNVFLIIIILIIDADYTKMKHWVDVFSQKN